MPTLPQYNTRALPQYVSRSQPSGVVRGGPASSVDLSGLTRGIASAADTPERFDDRIGASPTYSAVEATVRAPRSIYRAATGEGNPRAAVRDGLTAVGVLTGLPTGPLVRPLGYLADENRDGVTIQGLMTGSAK